jgi:hypothetical protein
MVNNSYPAWLCQQFATWKIAIEIVDFPHETWWWIFSIVVNVYQAGYPKKRPRHLGFHVGKCSRHGAYGCICSWDLFETEGPEGCPYLA